MEAHWVILAILAFAGMAIWSVRVLLELPPEKRLMRVALLAVSAIIGVLAVSAIADWGLWPLGIVIGLGLVELSPYIAKAGGVVIGAAGRALAKLFGRGKDKEPAE